MAFNPNDDRFYDSLNKSGDQYRSDRYRVAEDQAATSREIGQMYGELPQKTLQNGMAAADWRQNREKKNLDYQGEQADQKRSEENQGFERTRQGRLGEEWGIRKPMLQNDATQSNLTTQKAQMEADFGNQNTGAEESAKLGYTGPQPLTRAQARLMRGDQGDQLGLDTSKQNLANAKAQAGNIAAQIAANKQHLQNEQYDRAASMAATDLTNIYTIKNPELQAQALQDWRARNQKMISPEVLTDMAAGAGSAREAAIAQANSNKTTETKLLFTDSIRKAQELTDKLEATQKLAENAKVYEQNVSYGYQNPNADSARENAAQILENPMFNKHAVADQVRNGFAAKQRGILTDQAQKQAAETLTEFKTWYNRQDDKVRELPEVKRAVQQAEQLQAQAPTSQGMRKVPSLVGGAGGGQHTEANRNFLAGGGDQQAGAQGYGQMQAPPGLQPGPAMQANYFTQPPRPAPPAQPAPPPRKFKQDQLQQGHGQAPGQVPGQAPGMLPVQMPGDPYGLMKPRQGGLNGSR